MNTKFKANERAWSLRYGWGIVLKKRYISGFIPKYPITFNPDNQGESFQFTEEGKEFITDAFPTLFRDEVKEFPDPEYPRPKLNQNDLVWVWRTYDDEEEEIRREGSKRIRFFSHFEDGGCYCFTDGQRADTAKLAVKWSNWERYVDEK